MHPRPGVNESIELATLGPLLYLVILCAGMASLVAVAIFRWKVEGPLGLGVFLLGLAAAFVLAIARFGNFSDDRFLPLFLTPVLAVAAGTVIVVASLAMQSQRRGRLLSGAVRGAVAAGVVAVWLLARGAVDWLRAPYGFDVYGLIAVSAVTVLLLGADIRVLSPLRPGEDR